MPAKLYLRYLTYKIFRNFPVPQNYWDSGLFGTWEYVRLKKHLISATFLAKIEWSPVPKNVKNSFGMYL